MRRFARLSFGCIGVLVVVLAGLAIVSRWTDGPFAYFPAGPFTSGEEYQGSDPDWSVYHDDQTIEFQLLNPPRSRRTLVVAVDGHIFTHSGMMTHPLLSRLKEWPFAAEADPRVLVRREGFLYPLRIVRVTERALALEVMKAFERKYGTGNTPSGFDSGSMWLFEFVPRGL